MKWRITRSAEYEVPDNTSFLAVVAAGERAINKIQSAVYVKLEAQHD